MKQDWLEALLLAAIVSIFLGLLWAAIAGGAWMILSKLLRKKGLDSNWEHINHTRHGTEYKG